MHIEKLITGRGLLQNSILNTLKFQRQITKMRNSCTRKPKYGHPKPKTRILETRNSCIRNTDTLNLKSECPKSETRLPENKGRTRNHFVTIFFRLSGFRIPGKHRCIMAMHIHMFEFR